MIGETIFMQVQQEKQDEYTLEELLKLLQDEGLTDPDKAKDVTQQQRRNIQKARQQMNKPDYVIDSDLVQKGCSCFPGVQKKVENLAEAQQAIETSIRAKASPLYRTVETATIRFKRFVGKEYEIESIDELVSKRTELIKDVHDSIKEGEDYAVQLLEVLRDYKIKWLMAQFDNVVQYNTTLKTEDLKVKKLLASVEHHLDILVPKDKGYKEVSVANETLNAMNSYIESEITKANMDIVTHRDHKNGVTVLENIINLCVECCDIISKNMANVVETLQYSIPVMKSIEQQGKIAMISKSAIDPVTEYIMLNVDETKQTIEKISSLSSQIKQGSLPRALADALSSYTGIMIKANQMSSKKIEAEADKILTQPGYTT